MGLKVLSAKNEAQRKKLATESGIKGVTLFARVPSVSIPQSFPVDLMHMIWRNLIPQLIDLWTGDFNDMDDGLENYQMEKDVWGAICEACVPSRRTMPTSFGCPVPDPRKRSQFIAETWTVFTTQLAPLLLRKRFSDQRYYRHFVRLVKLLEHESSGTHNLQKSAAAFHDSMANRSQPINDKAKPHLQALDSDPSYSSLSCANCHLLLKQAETQDSLSDSH
ncbi:hypothetical protein RSAG8_05807, partial [Rhizoctonia solani AG-8 WAC10335]